MKSNEHKIIKRVIESMILADKYEYKTDINKLNFTVDASNKMPTVEVKGHNNVTFKLAGQIYDLDNMEWIDPNDIAENEMTKEIDNAISIEEYEITENEF